MRHSLCIALLSVSLSACVTASTTEQSFANNTKYLEEKRLAVSQIDVSKGVSLGEAQRIAGFYCEQFPVVAGATSCSVKDAGSHWEGTVQGGPAALDFGVIKISKTNGGVSSTWGPSFGSLKDLLAN